MNYEKLLEKARNAYKNCATGAEKRRLESIFPELKEKESEDEKIAKELIRYLPYCDDIAKDTKEKWIAWLEKQCEKSLFIWHNINDEPEEMRELLCEWESNDATWHDVAFYHSDRTFWNGTQQVENVVKWCYIDDLLEKQGKQNGTNLIEILKHYPKETELYSPLYGKLWLAEVDEENEIITCYKHCLDEGCTRAILEQEDTVSFYSDGTTGLPDFNVSKDCMLFLYDITKQGEQKSANTIESKFKVKDWITGEEVYTAKIINIDDDKYEVEFIDGSKGLYLIDFIDKFYHLWTIEDAKDGDVLATKNGVIFINDDSRKGKVTLDSYCYLSIQYEFCIEDHKTGSWLYKDRIKPATKEQREFFFAKMKKAGYEWDAENKLIRRLSKFHVGDKLISSKNPRLTYNILEVGHINELGNTEYKVEIFTDGKAQNPCNILYMECCKVDEWAELINQKSNDKVEPKFKAGDLVVDNCGYIWKIEGILNQFYLLEGVEGGESRPPIELANKNFHLWTIQDAKDGDVLSYVTDKGDLLILIYESLYKPYEGHVHYHAILENDKFSGKGTCCISIDNLKPATKEQRDLLFEEMGKSGYIWDVNRKEMVSVLKYK